MTRLARATGPLGTFLLALLAACGDGGGPARRPVVLVDPLLDSIFVGDTILPGALTVTYLDAAGDTQPTGPVTWGTTNAAVFTVDAATGRVVGQGRGAAVLIAVANGDTGNALVVVSDSLDLTLLLDTIYLQQGDTLTIPVQALHAGGGAPTVWFSPSQTPGVFTVDSSGRITANGGGGPLPYVAHAASGADTVADTGMVEVVTLTDTLGGKGYFSVLGTVIRRTRASVRGVNYKRQGDTLTFRLNFSVSVGTSNVENVVLTARTPVSVPGVFAIDSISPGEAFGAGNDFVCRPARAWGLWSLRTASLTLTALSRPGGSLRIAQVVPINHGMAISGVFTLPTQRVDLYADPDGGLPVRGTFVAPLVSDLRPCGS